MSSVNRVLAVVGATAAGKSDLAVELALRLAERGTPGEVINADSMQLYRGMDIGTAKLTAAERRGVPHHLLDIWEVTETADVARYQRLARGLIDDIQARGGVPILVGGSGLYVRGALDNLDFPGTDPQVRARLEAELADVGPAPLHARLAERDPAAAEAILPSNGRRIVRALEVIEVTGRPFTATLPQHVSRYPCAQIGLSVPRTELDERIELRVDRMWEAGLVDEVRELDQHGLREGRTASRALGYAQALRFLAAEQGRPNDDGVVEDYDEATARADTVRATRRFARRQDAWFRRDPRIHWLPYDAPDLADRAMELALNEVGDVQGQLSG
ncbi:tRNA (adenosine(37)-N6)-dimethylallyltransferase MiaA [Nocardiopsis gilva]